MTVRRSTRRRANYPEALADCLPDELRSFEAFYYPNGLHDYMAKLSAFLVEGQRLIPVMDAAGLSAADWFRYMLGLPSEAPQTAPAMTPRGNALHRS